MYKWPRDFAGVMTPMLDLAQDPVTIMLTFGGREHVLNWEGPSDNFVATMEKLGRTIRDQTPPNAPRIVVQVRSGRKTIARVAQELGVIVSTTENAELIGRCALHKLLDLCVY